MIWPPVEVADRPQPAPRVRRPRPEHGRDRGKGWWSGNSARPRDPAEGERSPAVQVLERIDHHARTDRNQQDVGGDAHVAVTFGRHAEAQDDVAGRVVIAHVARQRVANSPLLGLARRHAAVVLLRESRRAVSGLVAFAVIAANDLAMALGEVGAGPWSAVASIAVVVVTIAVVALVAIAIAVTVAIVATRVATVAVALIDSLLIVLAAVVAVIGLCALGALARAGLLAIGLSAAGVRGLVGERRGGEQGACERHCQHGHGFRTKVCHRVFSPLAFISVTSGRT